MQRLSKTQGARKRLPGYCHYKLSQRRSIITLRRLYHSNMLQCFGPPACLGKQTLVPLRRLGVIFVLEGANLEVAKVGKGYQLLNCDDHANFIKRNNKDPAEYRPDICHQALLMILDSPLNKAGKIKGLFVHTAKNVLVQINPQVRIPRTFKRFCGLMVQLLQKLSIRATNGPDKLLRQAG